MSDLTADEKAQVAELRYYIRKRRVAWHLLGLNWNPNHPRDCRLCEEKHPITLEALLAYCRERGWAHSLTYWRESQKYAAEIWATDDDDDPFAESIGDTDHTDPLTALVRAVLAAAEQEKSDA